MSESREKKRRYNAKLLFIAEFYAWMECEPPRWMFLRWRKWWRCRPNFKEAQEKIAMLPPHCHYDFF